MTAAGPRRRIKLALGLLGLGVAAPVAIRAYFWLDTRATIADGVSASPPRSVAIVPGAYVYRDGTPSRSLEDRLATARDLYLSGKVRRILVSGDHRRDRYDEVNAMHRWLVARGVPSSDVFLDHAGLRTLDTMERAARVFAVRDAVVCTQRFHLPRALYLARRAGIDAVGVVADRRRYRTALTNEARELVAVSRAFLDVFVFDTQAAQLGPRIDIDGDAARTHDARTRAFLEARRASP